MRSRRGSALVAAAFVALVGAAQSAAGPSTVTSGYTVGSLAVPGASTGLVLDGDSVTVTAAGTVCPGTGSCFGPDGDASVDTTQSGYGGFVAPGAPAWGLVARVGGGALPLTELPSFACAVDEELAAPLRSAEPPVVGVIRDGRLLLDCRTLTDHEVDEVASAVRSCR